MADGMVTPAIGPDIYASIIAGIEAENARVKEEEKNKVDTPAGPMRPDLAATTEGQAKIAEAFPGASNRAKDDLGGTPDGIIKTSAERVQEIIKEHEEGVAAREYKDNATKYLTMLAGTALMMAGAHNKNAGMFLAGGLMNKIGGFQLKNWYQQQNEALQQKVDPLLVAASRSGGNVKDAMDILQERIDQKGSSLLDEETDDVIENWPNMTEDEKAFLRDWARKQQPSVKAKALKGYEDAGMAALKKAITGGEKPLPWNRGVDAVKTEALRQLEVMWDTADQNSPIKAVDRNRLSEIAEDIAMNPPSTTDFEVREQKPANQPVAEDALALDLLGFKDANGQPQFWKFAQDVSFSTGGELSPVQESVFLHKRTGKDMTVRELREGLESFVAEYGVVKDGKVFIPTRFKGGEKLDVVHTMGTGYIPKSTRREPTDYIPLSEAEVMVNTPESVIDLMRRISSNPALLSADARRHLESMFGYSMRSDILIQPQ